MFHDSESIQVAFVSKGDYTVSWGPSSSQGAQLPADSGKAFSITLDAQENLYFDFSNCTSNLNLHYNGEGDPLIFSLVQGEEGGWSQDGNVFSEGNFHIGFARQTESTGIVIVGTIDLGGELH